MPVTTTLPNPSTQFISLETAIDMTALYRTNREIILQTIYRGIDLLPLSETFSRGAIDAILAHEECAGLRIYYGMDENEKLHAILVGVNVDNEDILPTGSLNEAEDPVIVENGQRCPPSCPPPSDLNE